MFTHSLCRRQKLVRLLELRGFETELGLQDVVSQVDP